MTMNYPSITSQPGSAKRNLDPIIQALEQYLSPTSQGSSSLPTSTGPSDPSLDSRSNVNRDKPKRRVLEIASYPYTHINAFSLQWPEVEWFGSARDNGEIQGINEVLDQEPEPLNLKRPRKLDIALEEDWEGLVRDVSDEGLNGGFEGVLMINLIHCTPPHLPESIFQHLSPLTPSGAMLLRPGGWIGAYAPWLADDGSYKSMGDEEFDRTHIKIDDPSLGLRSVKSIDEMAERWGFELMQRKEMPLGNEFVFWRAKRDTRVAADA